MRVLFASTRGAGHVGPLLPLARACLRAGHEVLLVAPASAARSDLPFRAVAEPTAEEVAAVWKPMWPPSPVPAAQVIQDLFVGLYARNALPSMLDAVAEWHPDAIVRETMEFSSALAAERYEVPQVQFGIHLDAATDSDGFLIGLAAAALDELRADAGLAPDPDAEEIRRSPLFTLSPRSFGGPAGIRRFRDNRAAPRMPDWDLPLVYVSFGSETPASELFPSLYRTAVDALAELPVRALVTIGNRRDPAELGSLPPTVRVERWVPQMAAMSRAAVMVGHGGSGSTLMALAAGVPQALVPLFVDGPSNARRVAELGAGIVLEDGPAADIGGAVRELLDMPRYSWAAGLVAAEILALPPIDDAVAELEAIAQRSAAGHAIR
jgi:UDP:flavonoid glycosyltransferase YjiC (YdhE family)